MERGQKLPALSSPPPPRPPRNRLESSEKYSGI